MVMRKTMCCCVSSKSHAREEKSCADLDGVELLWQLFGLLVCVRFCCAILLHLGQRCWRRGRACVLAPHRRLARRGDGRRLRFGRRSSSHERAERLSLLPFLLLRLFCFSFSRSARLAAAGQRLALLGVRLMRARAICGNAAEVEQRAPVLVKVELVVEPPAFPLRVQLVGRNEVGHDRVEPDLVLGHRV